MHYDTNALEMEIAQLRSENQLLRASLRNKEGDNLCWLTDKDLGKVPPLKEFIKSCERYHAQIASERGILTGSKTIAQLECENQELRNSLDQLTAVHQRHTEQMESIHQEITDLEHTFELRWKADMRAIKQWQEAKFSKEFVFPDHTDLCVWLIEKLDDAT